MGTLINGADAGVAIITSAVAAANATLIRAHQVVGQIDTMANEWAQSPVGSIIGQPPRESPLKQLTLLSYLLVADHGSGMRDAYPDLSVSRVHARTVNAMLTSLVSCYSWHQEHGCIRPDDATSS